LGELTAQYGTGDFPLSVASGECRRFYRTVFAELTVALSDAAQPYADALRYSLEVDGKPYLNSEWYGFERSLRRSAIGPTKERMHTLCEEDLREHGAQALPPGPHRVRMIGLLNDDTRIESNEIQVELQCPPASRLDGDAADAQTDRAPAADSAAGPVSTIAMEASPLRAAESHAAPLRVLTEAAPSNPAGAREAPETQVRNHGAECSLHHSGQRGKGLVLGTSLLAFCLVRRRSRRSA
jgi:hypothetical protein